MKTLIAVFAIFLILSIAGCKENLVSQPELSLNSEQSSYSLYDVTKGEINICCSSFDPITGECKILGKVTYRHNILEYYAKTTKIKLDLEMDAELFTRLMNPARHTIYSICCDTLLINGSDKLLLDKTYEVMYRPDLRLCVQYVVTPEGVGILQMNLLQWVQKSERL